MRYVEYKGEYDDAAVEGCRRGSKKRGLKKSSSGCY